MSRDLLRLRRGHAPNCSSGSSVVGAALVSATVAAALINAWAHRFLHELPPSDPDDHGPKRPRLRREHFGAILAWAGVQLHISPAWADHARARGIEEVGADAQPVEGALSAPTEVHLAVTERCPAPCRGCYLGATPDGAHADLDALRGALDALAALGTFEVALGGGEALLRPELLSIVQHAHDRGLTPNLTVSGIGLTPARARALAPLVGQVNISIDGLGAVYVAARGWDGAARGLEAVRTLSAAGVRVGVNTVLSRPLLETPGALRALGAAIRAAGAAEWQWLRFKPTGRGTDTWAALAPSSGQLAALWEEALDLEDHTDLTIRYDCALTPFIAAAGVPAARMDRMGVSGCVGGESLLSRDARGGWAPCSFVPATAPGPSAAAAWRADAAVLAWRARAASPPEPCASCEHQATCRGGCRAVSAHLTGDPMAPDPQCPRVQSWTG